MFSELPLPCQVASHTGYVKVDWQLLEQDVTKAKEQLKFHGGSSSSLPPDVKNRMDEVRLSGRPNGSGLAAQP